MENDFYSDLREAMKTYSIGFQLVPPNMHRQNTAERAIRICKNNFISELSTTDPDFPIREWYLLISHCLIIQNLLCNSRVKPALSE